MSIITHRNRPGHAGSASRHFNRWRTAMLGSGRSARIAGVLVLAGATAWISSIPMPRGPVDATQGLAAIGISALIGLGAGSLLRSRWAMVLPPLAYVATYEVARLGIGGATVGWTPLDSVYGIAALATGRGLHGMLTVLPMIVGAGVAVVLARPRRRLPGLIASGVAAMAIIGLAVLVALPASTPPVLGGDGQPVPGGIAELSTVELNGTRQAISVRAADPDNPVLLYLSGGPGQSDIAFARALLEPLTGDFVVVVWDQRGSGKSYGALDPGSTYTLEALVSDTIALTDHLRARFDEDKIYLLGESWGSTLGVLAVEERPDLFHAYIGSGQMVSQRVTDQIIWRDLLAYAQEAGDWELYDEILSLGEPPYRDSPWANSVVMGHYGLIETPYQPSAAYIARGEASGIGQFGLFGSEYSFIENANLIRGLVDMFSLIYPQLQHIDFRSDVPSLDVPVYLLDGVNELRGRRELADEWFLLLDAPLKRQITFENAGHAVAFEQVDALRLLLAEEIVPATYPR